MAVQRTTDVQGTGLQANHWVLTALAVHRAGTTNNFSLSGTYELWRDAAAYAAGMSAVPGQKARAVISLLAGNPTLGNQQAQLDAAIVAPGGALEGGTVV